MTDPQFLLDTNICIYLMEGLSERARERVEDLAPGQLVTSSIAYAETIRGLDLENKRVAAIVAGFFRLVTVVPFDAAAAHAYRRIPFKRGRYDHLIAAHALALDLVLVTNDERDFADIPDLRVENWTR